MEYDYNGYSYAGQYQELKVTSVYQGEDYGISAIAFDLQEDLLWAATYGGHVTSFYGTALNKYTAFQAHQGDVRQLQSTLEGLVSITANELRMTSRTGHPMFTMRDENSLVDMNCVLYLDETSLLVGCQGNKITTVDLTQAQVLGEVGTGAGICLLKAAEACICSGDVNGQVYLLDPRTLEVVNSYSAHTSGMCDMDVVGNYLVTCGLTQQFGQMFIDSQLKVFDLRTNRPLPPLDVVMLQPFLICAIPTLNSTILVVSQLGQFQLLDLRGLVTPETMMVNQLSSSTESAMACALDVGTSCEHVAFGDSCGIVHLWADHDDVKMLNPYSTQCSVFPDPVTNNLPSISWNDTDLNSDPLSAVPMSLTPHKGDKLLSDWPLRQSRFKRRVTPPIDPEVLDNMRMQHFVGHAPKPPYTLRNQVPYNLEKDDWDSVPESPMMRENNPLTLVPKPYRQVEIKYSKLGIETFDFRHYNSTKFSGLEIHIPNAYCNSMLQVLYFLEPVRCSLQNHLCAKEFCLACELGFLFRMLDHADGRSCQASNFLRAFRTLREASGLGLLLNWEDDQRSNKVDLAKLIQNWTRFVLQQVNQETQPQQQMSPTLQINLSGFHLKEASKEETIHPQEESIIHRLFGSELETSIQCQCGWTSTTTRTELLFSLVYSHSNKTGYPRSHVTTDGSSRVSFSSVLHQSICKQQRLQAWCEQCSKYKSTIQRKHLRHLPYILTLNCQIDSDQSREFWSAQQQGASPLPYTAGQKRWIPLEMELKLEDSNLSVREGPLEKTDSTMPLPADSTMPLPPDSTTLLPSDSSTPLPPDSTMPLPPDSTTPPPDSTTPLPPDSTTPPPDSTTPLPPDSTTPLPSDSTTPLPPHSTTPLSPDSTTPLSPDPTTPLPPDSVSKQPQTAQSAVYELMMVVSYVKEPWMEPSGNLVTHINVGRSYHLRKENVSKQQWYLFNDFHITPMQESDIGVYPTEWLTPCVLVYAQRGYSNNFPTEVMCELEPSVLLAETHQPRPVQSPATFTPLSFPEFPNRGDVVGIDAEFVSLNQEEAEVKSDGTHKTLKPSQLSVARITVTRGKGPGEGSPFIDDYIATSEQVVDYLTKFSGIKAGDLDASMSSKHLTTLKASYLKLLFLVDRGVVFVGHGLKKDFRVINIMVPSDQVVDTVELFHLPNLRYVSLKFLAWFYVGLRVQQGAHDSAEDARTAVLLYHKYKDLESRNSLQDSLKKLYETGRECGWIVPDS